MYQGLLGFYGNPLMHSLQQIDPIRARQVVAFVDNLLHLLGLAQKANR